MAAVQICGEVKLRMMYDNPDAIALFRFCGEMGLPVTLHFDNYGAQQTGKEFPRRSWWYGGDIDTLERLLKLCPETNFLGHAPGFWCHISADDLGYTQAYPKAPVVPGGRIEQLLEKSGLFGNLGFSALLNLFAQLSVKFVNNLHFLFDLAVVSSNGVVKMLLQFLKLFGHSGILLCEDHKTIQFDGIILKIFIKCLKCHND